MANVTNVEPCARCAKKNNRNRPSLCRCNCCLQSYCIDCIKDHHEELININEMTDTYNRVRSLCDIKEQALNDETLKTIDQIEQWYIGTLKIKEKFIEDANKFKTDTKNHISAHVSLLQSLLVDLQSFAKQNAYDPLQSNTISEKLDQIEKDINKLTVSRKIDLPELVIQSEPQLKNIEKAVEFNPGTQIVEINSTSKNNPTDGNEICSEQTSDKDISDNLITMTYAVDCLASDGVNLMYTCTDPQLIAYYYTDKSHDIDPSREWKLSHVIDMIYWKGLQKFVCATLTGIYAVEYANGKFKILVTIQGSLWHDVRVAANDTNLWVWINPAKRNFDSIKVYSKDFKHLHTIDFGSGTLDPFRRGTSFSLTNTYSASISRRVINKGHVVQINIFDKNLKLIKSQDLGCCGDNVQIRSSKNNVFFITTGLDIIHVVPVHGQKSRISLKHSGHTIAIVDATCFFVGNFSNTLELVQNQCLEKNTH